MSSTSRARDLRKTSTEVEKILWHHLRNRNLCDVKFKRQYRIGHYIVDFICLQRKLIIELDGSQHYDTEQYDAKRTSYLKARGYEVIRFWNNAITEDIDPVLQKIHLESEVLSPATSI